MRVEAVGKGNVITNAADYTKAELNSMSFANETLQHAVFAIDLDAQTDYQSLLNRNDELSRGVESVAKGIIFPMLFMLMGMLLRVRLLLICTIYSVRTSSNVLELKEEFALRRD